MLLQTVILMALSALGSTSEEDEVYDTIIVGMGPAGCAAASVLCRADRNVLALEAQDRIGGRVHTRRFGDGVVEEGAEWIAGAFPNIVYEIAIRHNITILSQNADFQPYRSDGSNRNEELISELLTYALAAYSDPPSTPEPQGQHITERSDGSNRNEELISELLTYALAAYSDPPSTPEPQGQHITESITDYIRDHHPSLLEDTEFMDYLFHYLDLSVSLIEGSDSWNDVSTFRTYESMEGPPLLSWHEHGFYTLFEILLNTYQDGPGYSNLNLQLKKVVTRITYPQDPDEDVEVTCEDGSTYRARNVIVTVSLGVLQDNYESLFSPELPQSKIEAINGISMGLIGKIILLFPNQWWDDNESDAFNFYWRTDDVEYAEDDWTFNIPVASICMGNRNALSLTTSGDTTRMIEAMDEDEIRRGAMDLLRRFLGRNKTVPDPIDMVRSRWYSNPYTRGTFSFSDLRSPLDPNIRDTLAEPLVDSSGAPRVLFAGEATNKIHFSEVHGAVETGFREGERLLSEDP